MTVIEYVALPRIDARFGRSCSDGGSGHEGSRYVEVWVQDNGIRRRTKLCSACAKRRAGRHNLPLPESES